METRPVDAQSALRLMWSVAEKHERLRVLHRIVEEPGYELTSKEFWGQFWQVWTSSENLNDDGDYIPDLIDYGHNLGSPWDGLDEEERTFLASIGEITTVYRGCVEWNQMGWSWTLDRNQAKKFADRASCKEDAERLILSAQVRRRDILAYLTGRNESEIVVDPDNLLDTTVEERYTIEGGPNVGLFYAIQSGRFWEGGGQLDHARAAMMARTVNRDFDKAIALLDQQIGFMLWAGCLAKHTYTEILRGAIIERSKNPEPEGDFKFFM